MATYWIVVGGAVNFDTARERGFDMFGFKSTRRKESALMQPGDKLIFYLTGVMKLGGIATITSEVFEDHSPVFVSKKKPQEDYPFRVQTKPDLILEPGDYLEVREIGPLLEYTRKWPPEHWRLAFQGNLHRIPEADYTLIRREMEQAVAARA